MIKMGKLIREDFIDVTENDLIYISDRFVQLLINNGFKLNHYEQEKIKNILANQLKDELEIDF